jgi:replicative DNA helicase
MRDSIRDELYEAEDLVLSDDTDTFKKALTTKEWTDAYIEEFKKRKDGKQYWFNEPVLDKIVVDGPIPETGGIIAAQSGMGKSTFVLNLVNKLIDSGIPCMYFSLEMGQISTMDRLLAARLQIPYSDIVNPPDSETFYTVYQRILDEKKKLELNKNFRFSENPDISIASLKKEIKKFQNEIGQQYCIVILDLITMVKDFCIGSNSGASLATTIEMAVNKMNALSKELKIHYIGTAQLNRTGESATITDIEDIDKLRPSRHQIKNSGALLERCRYAISLFRRKFYIDQNFPDDPVAQAEDDTIEVQLLKQSNGECKRYYELFNGQCFTVTPLDIEESVEA